MLYEIDELAGELKCPVESTRRMIHVELNRELKKMLQPSVIDLFASRILREKQTERKRVRHLRVVHFHIWSNLTLRRFRIIGGEAVDHVIRLRTVGDDPL